VTKAAPPPYYKIARERAVWQNRAVETFGIRQTEGTSLLWFHFCEISAEFFFAS